MSSVSFDPVAHQYDATRGFPEDVARQVAHTIDQAVNGNPQTRIFEVGVGTGRIAVPLVEYGRQYTGIDISEKMLSRLEEKLRATGWREASQEWGSIPGEDAMQKLEVQRFIHEEKPGLMSLLIADMTAIPFYDHAFDAVIAVHVFHLVSNWQKALQEIMRVLRSGGVLVRCWQDNWEELWKAGPGDIRREWSKIVEELGGSTAHPGVGEQVVTEWLQEQGFETEQVDVVTWEQKLTPRTVLQGIEQRIWTSTLFVPEDLFAESIKRLRQWIDEHYGETIDDEYVHQQPIVISRTRISF
jgi:ubiquinone/menaquinone biosynthesis C-methylase UbiE